VEERTFRSFPFHPTNSKPHAHFRYVCRRLLASDRPSRPSSPIYEPEKHTTPGIGALPNLLERIYSPYYATGAKDHANPHPHISHVYSMYGSSSNSQIQRNESEFLLHHLRTVILGRIAHHLGFVDGGLTPTSGIRAVRRTLSAAFDEDMSLFVQSAFCLLHKNLPPIAAIRIG
jgi:hypothetical protein